MAEPLKNMYTGPLLQKVAAWCVSVLPGFSTEKFLLAVLDEAWESRELKQRVAHISVCINEQLTGKYEGDVHNMVALSNRIMADIGHGDTFVYMFIPNWIELYGTQHLQASLAAMEHVTKLVSCEYAIRPFLNNYLEATIQRMLQWTTHEHPSVRRFASEGCRPALPWGKAVPALKRDPSPILPILEQLKDDDSLFVRKSVANNLNDISKTHPELVMDIITRWKGTGRHTDWIIKHGARTLLKKGSQEALSSFGVHQINTVQVSELTTNGPVAIGNYLQFSFTVTHKETSSVTLRLEYRISYARPSGNFSKKIFKISEGSFETGKQYAIQRKQSFKDMTIRKHYAGTHILEIVVNGNTVAETTFEVV